MNGELYFGMPPARSGTSSPLAAEASSFSAACWRYSQLAHPAQAKTARINKTTVRTIVLRFKGIDLFPSIVRGKTADREQGTGYSVQGLAIGCARGTFCSLFTVPCHKLLPSKADEPAQPQRSRTSCPAAGGHGQNRSCGPRSPGHPPG